MMYRALTTIRYNGELYATGAPIKNLDDASAAQLKAVGAVELIAGEPEPAGKRPDDPAAVAAAIRAAIGQLPPTDYTKAGQPKVAAVTERLGYAVTAEEIAAVVAGGVTGSAG